ncbi:hypothetical protein ACFL5O_11250 [Myxococcota bacterium]
MLSVQLVFVLRIGSVQGPPHTHASLPAKTFCARVPQVHSDGTTGSSEHEPVLTHRSTRRISEQYWRAFGQRLSVEKQDSTLKSLRRIDSGMAK